MCSPLKRTPCLRLRGRPSPPPLYLEMRVPRIQPPSKKELLQPLSAGPRFPLQGGGHPLPVWMSVPVLSVALNCGWGWLRRGPPEAAPILQFHLASLPTIETIFGEGEAAFEECCLALSPRLTLGLSHSA